MKNCPGIHENLYWRLIDALIHTKHNLYPLFESHDITPIQAYVVTLLTHEDGKPMSYISQVLHCDASNTTILVDRLEALELIERRPDPNDRRVKLLFVTKKGKQLKHELSKGLAELEREALDNSGLTNSELRKALDTIETFTDQSH